MISELTSVAHTYSPVWLSRVLVWATSSTLGSSATLEPKGQKLAVSAAQDTSLVQEGPSAEVTEATVVEPETSFNAVALLYEDAVNEANRTSRVRLSKTTALLCSGLTSNEHLD